MTETKTSSSSLSEILSTGKRSKRRRNITNFVASGTVGNFKANGRKIKRGGCILYYMTKNGPLFGLGLDRHHKEFSDFGGSFDKTKDNDIIDTALRELYEETVKTCKISRDDYRIPFCLSIYSPTDFIMFIPVADHPKDVKRILARKIDKCKTTEMESVVWFTKDELFSAINDKKVYERVASLISRAPSTLFDLLK